MSKKKIKLTESQLTRLVENIAGEITGVQGLDKPTGVFGNLAKEIEEQADDLEDEDNGDKYSPSRGLGEGFNVKGTKVWVYDLGADAGVMDRYNVYIEGDEGIYLFGMSKNAISPRGFNQLSGRLDSSFDGPVGEELNEDEVPEDVMKAIRDRIND